jgi:hypothetical protein
LDETAEIESSRAERQWLVRIPAKHGWIGVHSDTELTAYCTARRLFPSLLAVPSTRQRQRGDRELAVSFDPEHLDRVAAILKARRKRIMSPAQREQLIAARQQSPLGRGERPLVSAFRPAPKAGR